MKEFIVRRALLFTLIFTAAVYLAGCQTMQGVTNKTKEMFGVQKRAILVSEVKEARTSMEEVKAKFQTAMETFNTVLTGNEGKLDKKYRIVKSEHEKTENKAGDIQENIGSVSKVAEELFLEWQTELNNYSSESLRKSGEQRLQDAKNQNTQFINAMTRADEKAGPVITGLGDLVLFSKHNLNARDMESIKGEMDSLAEKVTALITEIDASITEADKFIDLMEGSEAAQ